jgi:hypothetical protein
VRGNFIITPQWQDGITFAGRKNDARHLLDRIAAETTLSRVR